MNGCGLICVPSMENRLTRVYWLLVSKHTYKHTFSCNTIVEYKHIFIQSFCELYVLTYFIK